jgi:hypothetical protein
VIAVEVLTALRSRGVELTVADGVLWYRAPRGVLTPELRATLSAHKAELLQMLNPPRDARRLDLADCITLIRKAFETVESDYVDGALALLDADPDLCRRFRESGEAIDAAVKAGPTEGELRAALTAHVVVICECCERKRARQEWVADMPGLPADTVAAVGFRYAAGGAWVSVKRERGQ